MAFVALLVSIPIWFFSGFVFMKLWEWFPHTIFNLDMIGYAESLGLILFLSFLRSKKFDLPDEKDKDKQHEKSMYASVMYLIYLILALVFGYIVHTFI